MTRSNGNKPRAFDWLTDWLVANLVLPEEIDPTRRNVLELVQFLALGFDVVATILALVLSYLNRSQGRGSTVEGHSYWVTRTFWYFLIFALASGVVGGALEYEQIAFFMLFVTALWVIYRCLRGLYLLMRGRRFANPKAII